MKEGSRHLLNRAGRAIEASETLLENGYPEFATGRAYYAMFYIAEALLNEKELRFSKHGGVHGAFGEHYVKTGLFDGKYHRWLLDAFDRRIEGGLRRRGRCFRSRCRRADSPGKGIPSRNRALFVQGIVINLEVSREGNTLSPKVCAWD